MEEKHFGARQTGQKLVHVAFVTQKLGIIFEFWWYPFGEVVFGEASLVDFIARFGLIHEKEFIAIAKTRFEAVVFAAINGFALKEGLKFMDDINDGFFHRAGKEVFGHEKHGLVGLHTYEQHAEQDFQRNRSHYLKFITRVVYMNYKS